MNIYSLNRYQLRDIEIMVLVYKRQYNLNYRVMHFDLVLQLN